MAKKARQVGIQQRKQQLEKDLKKAEKRRELEKERSAARRKKMIQYLRSEGAVKKVKQKKSSVNLAATFPSPEKIRREDVVIDKHTDSRKAPQRYRLEGDNGWV
jgi:hypothetical protein